MTAIDEQLQVDDATSRVENAYQFLIGEIMSFRIRTGAPLSENRIATQLGISRTPVREALQRLEKEGLIKRTENARFTVSQPTMKEAAEACDLLEVLDSFVARRAADRLTDEQAQELRASVETMRAAAAQEDRDAWAEADATYHRLLNTIADNALVAETLKATRRRVQRFWLYAASAQHRLVMCSDEHAVMADAMIARDYDAIDAGVHEHISHMRERVLDLLSTTAMFYGG